MPVQLATITLTASSTSGSISLAAMQVSALPRSSSGPYAHLEVVNESASGLVFNFPNTTNDRWVVPAGKHRFIPIPPGESQANWTVLNSYPTNFNQACYLFYFEFNEALLDLGQIGTSQIGTQPRNIALGPAPQDDHGSVTLAGGASQDTNLSYGIQPANIANGSTSIFFYWIVLRIFVSVAGNDEYSVFVESRTVGGATVQSVEIAKTPLAAGANLCDTYSLQFGSAAKYTTFPTTGVDNATHIVLRLHNNGSSAPILYWDIGWATEIFGTPTVAGPGTHGRFNTGRGPW